MSYLARKVWVPEVTVANLENQAVLRATSLTFGSTVYAEDFIQGQLVFDSAPTITTLSENADSAVTRAFVNTKVGEIFTQDNVWIGKNVFQSADSVSTILETLNVSYQIGTINIDYLLWVKAGEGTIYLPTSPLLNQKITIRSDSSSVITIHVGNEGFIVSAAGSLTSFPPSLELSPYSAMYLYCAVTTPPTWLLL